MAIRVLGNDGSLWYAWCGIEYALKMGAKISSNSWGTRNWWFNETTAEWTFIEKSKDTVDMWKHVLNIAHEH